MLKNKTNRTKGFTMIELLMVVGIIGLLVAIIVVSVTLVRTKAGNSIIKNDVDQLRKFAETMYAENGLRGYCVVSGENSCFELDNSRLTELKTDIIKRSESKLPASVDMSADVNNFCVSVELSDGDRYCLDSTANQTSGICSASLCQ